MFGGFGDFGEMGGMSQGTSVSTSTYIDANGRKITETKKTYYDSDGNQKTETSKKVQEADGTVTSETKTIDYPRTSKAEAITDKSKDRSAHRYNTEGTHKTMKKRVSKH